MVCLKPGLRIFALAKHDPTFKSFAENLRLSAVHLRLINPILVRLCRANGYSAHLSGQLHCTCLTDVRNIFARSKWKPLLLWLCLGTGAFLSDYLSSLAFGDLNGDILPGAVEAADIDFLDALVG